MIFNQWTKGQCEGYAFLAALEILDPSLDFKKIDAELQEIGNLAYPGKAGQWFKEKGYIDNYYPVKKLQVKALINRHVPLITGSRFWDFSKVVPPVFRLTFDRSNEMQQHEYVIVNTSGRDLVCQNSWGEEWGDDWYFRVSKDDYRFLDTPFRIIPKLKDPHKAIVKKYMYDRIDFDKAYRYQCVDWIKEYSTLRNRPIVNYGSAFKLWEKGLWKNYTRVISTPGNFPEEWDIVFWGPTWGGWFGHTAIANKFCNPLLLRTIDQNAWSGNGDGLEKNSINPFFRTYSGVVGWFKWVG